MQTEPKRVLPPGMGLFLAAILAYLIGLTIGGAQPPTGITDSLIEERNAAIAQTLATHPVDRLIGEFWRIVPIRQQGMYTMDITALATCPSGAASLRAELRTDSSFAYLTSPMTDMKTACSTKAVFAALGPPTARTTITTADDQIQDEILFYDKGSGSKPAVPPSSSNREVTTGSFLASPLQAAERQACSGHRTILQIAAHEDDDLLFMNPDLLHSIQQGDCVRTVYLTAGDAGGTKFYWLNRERGSEAAYSPLAGIDDEWRDQTVRFGDHRFATLANPTGSSRLSLSFLHLPDGKPDGSGFGSSHNDSLAKLISGEKASVSAVDGQSHYTTAELEATLRSFMDVYQPAEVRTQLPYSSSSTFSDHSDHVTVGRLVTAAFQSYRQRHPAARLSYYTGYPVREQGPNVEAADLAVKEQAFFAYAHYDAAVCGSMDDCLSHGTYGDYLQRQYRTEP